jgi:hypothetical protein
MRSIRKCLIRGKGAFPREVGDLIRFQAKVIAIHQTDRGVTVHGTNYGNRLEAVPIGACGCIAVCWRVEQSGKKAFRAHQRCTAVFRHFALSFPSHYLGVAEAPQCVWILAPAMPGRSNSLQLGTGGKAVF